MAVFFKTLFNIITEHKETVYIFFWNYNTVKLPAIKYNGVLFLEL